eukprot:6457131-Prymnesium_polylepis.2
MHILSTYYRAERTGTGRGDTPLLTLSSLIFSSPLPPLSPIPRPLPRPLSSLPLSHTAHRHSKQPALVGCLQCPLRAPRGFAHTARSYVAARPHAGTRARHALAQRGAAAADVRQVLTGRDADFLLG